MARFPGHRREDRGHHLGDGCGLRRVCLPVGEQPVPGTDQDGAERVDVGIGRDAAQVPLRGEVGRDHHHGLGQHRNAGRPVPAQPGAQRVAEVDEGDDRHRRRPEQCRQRPGEVAGHRAGPGGLAQGGGLRIHPLHAVEHELGEERVEVGEVPVQHPLRHPGLRGDRPAGQRARPAGEQDPLGGIEQLLACIADGHPCRHLAPLHPLPGSAQADEWAYAHS